MGNTTVGYVFKLYTDGHTALATKAMLALSEKDQERVIAMLNDRAGVESAEDDSQGDVTVKDEKSDDKASAIELPSLPDYVASKKYAGQLMLAVKAHNQHHAEQTRRFSFELDDEKITVTFADFPYDLRDYAGKYLPASAKTLITAYCAPFIKEKSADYRNRFNAYLAAAIGVENRSVMRGHRFDDKWLEEAHDWLESLS